MFIGTDEVETKLNMISCLPARAANALREGQGAKCYESVIMGQKGTSSSFWKKKGDFRESRHGTLEVGLTR